jgi:calmodulin
MYRETEAKVQVRIFSQDEARKYKRSFDAYDDDNDGRVAVEHLGRVIRAIGFNPLPEEVADMIEDIQGPSFDFDSLLYILSRHAREADPEAELVDCFKVFDKDGSRRLKVSLVSQILRSLRKPFTDAQINRLLSKLEIDESETVDLTELAKEMT